MAEVKNCLGIRGRVGDFVLYRLGGKTFLRKRAKRNDSNTEEQRAVRARFRTAVRFYQKLKETPLDEVLDIAAQGICVSGYAFFMKENLKAFGPDGRIKDYSQLQFAAGKRQKVFNLEGWVDKEGQVTLKWMNSLIGTMTEGKDRLGVMVLREDRAFSPEVIDELTVCRKEREAHFRVFRKKGKKVHVYCYFISPNGKVLSPSQYICLQEEE